MELLSGFFLVLAIIYLVPIVIYGIGQMLAGLKMPKGATPQVFLWSVLISKIGTALGFVLIFYLAHDVFSESWVLYSGIWFVMFAIGEVGQAFIPNYTWKEAIAGIISEIIYFPLSAFALSNVVKN